jgi:phenylacetate-CoA ligase
MMQAAETARARIPHALRPPLRRLYALVPLNTRLGKDYWRLKTLLQGAELWDRERIEAWQLQKLKETITYAYERVPGYHLLFRDAGVKPDDIESMASIGYLPFTTKELLRDNLKDFTATGIPAWRLNYVTTGGSTGIPFGFFHTATDAWREKAFIHSSWERVGWQPGHSSVVLRGDFVGSEDAFWEYNPVDRTLSLSTYFLTEHTYDKYLRKTIEFRARHLQAYPSAATALADLVLDHGDEGRLGFEVILLGSETLYDWQKERIRQAFPNASLFSWYGHAEQVVLAPWCEHTESHHVWPFYGLAELLDAADREVQQGEVGEIVGTSFWGRGTPFIRYRTMDRARKGPYGCKECGRQFPLFERIEGRLQEFILTGSGRYISMTAVNMHSDVFDNVRQFQFFQDTPGQVLFRVVPKESFSHQDRTTIHRELMKKLGKDVELSIVTVDVIPRRGQGKYGFLDQRLAIGHGEQGMQSG